MKVRYIFVLLAAIACLNAAAQDIDTTDSIAVEISRFDGLNSPLLDFVSPDKESMAMNMLDRVEKIDIIEAFDIDSVEFFTALNNYIHTTAGEILSGKKLNKKTFPYGTPDMALRTATGKEYFWAEPRDSVYTLMTCRVLDNGMADTAYPLLGDAIDADEPGDCRYPYVMQDGYTIYFANNGPASLGGYDIFMTRRDAEGDVLQPQNIGMPYNSPFNDYMMVIDEDTNTGLFVSDRKGVPGKVTVYMFHPSAMRVNYDADTPDIERLALLCDVKSTHRTDHAAKPAVTVKDPEQAIWLNGKRIVYSDLTNSQDRTTFKQIVELYNEQDAARARLDSLRAAYAAGDKSVADDILNIEKRLRALPLDIQRLRNKLNR